MGGGFDCRFLFWFLRWVVCLKNRRTFREVVIGIFLLVDFIDKWDFFVLVVCFLRVIENFGELV